jgi:hypothetical protein
MFCLEAKKCEKGSEKNFASKRNKGLVREMAIFACKKYGYQAKNSETK